MAYGCFRITVSQRKLLLKNNAVHSTEGGDIKLSLYKKLLKFNSLQQYGYKGWNFIWNWFNCFTKATHNSNFHTTNDVMEEIRCSLTNSQLEEKKRVYFPYRFARTIISNYKVNASDRGA